MNATHPRQRPVVRLPRLAAAMMAVLLSGCQDMPRLNVMGPNYKPISSEVATIAAPHAPGEAASASAPAADRPLYCRVLKGTAQFGSTWKDFAGTDFSVEPDGRANVALSPLRGKDSVSFQAYFDAAGQKVIFCPVVEGPPEKEIACSSLYVLDDDLESGIKRTFDVPNAVRGSSITCAWNTAALKSENAAP